MIPNRRKQKTYVYFQNLFRLVWSGEIITSGRDVGSNVLTREAVFDLGFYFAHREISKVYYHFINYSKRHKMSKKFLVLVKIRGFNYIHPNKKSFCN